MPATAIQRGVCVEAAGATLAGWLYLPPDPTGFVIFASSRDLLRIDRHQVDLSEALNKRGLGTLLFDLIDETDSAEVEQDVGALAGRLIGATGWSRKQWGASGLPLGYVGSGRGSAAALSAAAALIPKVRAIASNGGRPDLAGEAISSVQTPTLLLADAQDSLEVEAARTAAAYLSAPHRIYQVHERAHQTGRWAATPSICRWIQWHLTELV
jgi:putative phosphoribosyl transferase